MLCERIHTDTAETGHLYTVINAKEVYQLNSHRRELITVYFTASAYFIMSFSILSNFIILQMHS